MSSFSSTASVHSVIGEKQAKKLEKVLAREAHADQQAIDHALQDIKEVEKALKKCSQSVEKAQKKISKTKEKEIATAKVLNKAKHSHADALQSEAKAADALNMRRAHEAETDQNARQMQTDLDDFQRTMDANAMDRELRLSEIRAQFE